MSCSTPGGRQCALIALVTVSVIGVALCNVAQAVLIAYEPFNYSITPGVPAPTVLGQSGGVGFSGPWESPRPGGGGGAPAGSNTIVAGSLAGPAGLPTVGNHALLTAEAGTMDGLARAFPEIPGTDGTTTWISLLAQRQGATTDPNNTDWPNNLYPRGVNLSFYDVDGTAETPGAPDERISIGNSSNAANNEWSIIPEGDGNLREGPASHLPEWSTLAWGVMRIDHVGDETVGDSAWLWVNPDPLGGEPLTANADVEILSGDANSQDFGLIDFLRPFVGNQSSSAGMSNFRPFGVLALDEIRIGTTWDDMRNTAGLPEPATGILLFVGGLAIWYRRRTR